MKTLKKIEIYKTIVAIALVIAFILIVGTVGGLETDTITLGRALIQGSILVTIFGLESLAWGWLKEREADVHKYLDHIKNRRCGRKIKGSTY